MKKTFKKLTTYDFYNGFPYCAAGQRPGQVSVG